MTTRPEPQQPPHGGSWIMDPETGVLTPNTPAPAPVETPAPSEQEPD